MINLPMRGIRVALTDDIKCLYHRHPGFHHGGQLAAENGDIFRGNRFFFGSK
jgi:hypothetical protein